MSFQVRVERLIARRAHEVFAGLKAGHLFVNCGADSRSMTIDFRVGGKYKIVFTNYQVTNFGEFIEIVPNKKVVFSWCQHFGADQSADSQVSLELFEDGSKTRLVLVHTGFRTQEIATNHQNGWDAMVVDFGDQVQNGRLRMLRTFKSSVEDLYQTCQNPKTFFALMGDLAKGAVDFKVGAKYELPNDNDGIKGEFLEIEPNKKIVFSWLMGCTGPLSNSKVTLNFSQKDAETSRVEILHEGLISAKDQVAHRGGWEGVTEGLTKILSGGKNDSN